jgi:phenylacetate-CoA ligase
VETKDGLVIWEDHFYPEIIDPRSGQVLPDGTMGELVITSLTREATPVIRYRTRDLAQLLPPTARSMRRIGRILGRTDDMLIIRGVNVFPSQIEELLLKEPLFAPQYQLIVTRESHLDDLEVRVEMRENRDVGDQGRLARELQLQIKAWVGVSCSATVLLPGSIERVVVGKAKRVIDKRPKLEAASSPSKSKPIL